jgi:YcxB-like protein
MSNVRPMTEARSHEPIVVTFSLTPDDVDRLRKIVAMRLHKGITPLSPFSLARIAAWFCMVGAFTIFAFVVSHNPQLFGQVWLAAGLLYVATLLAAVAPRAANGLLRKRVLSPRGGFLLPQSVEFGDELLVVSSAASRIEIPWGRVLDREEDTENIYLFIDELRAVVLPRRAIAPLLGELDTRTSHLKNAA